MSEQEDEAKSVALSRAIEMAVIETLDQLNVTDCDPQVIPILMEFVKSEPFLKFCNFCIQECVKTCLLISLD